MKAMGCAAQALLAALAMAVSGNACALVNWDWAFENVAPVRPQDTVYVRATLFNDPSSTESLDMPSMFASVSFDSPSGRAVEAPVSWADRRLPNVRQVV